LLKRKKGEKRTMSDQLHLEIFDYNVSNL
jgi:hypothetical protein